MYNLRVQILQTWTNVEDAHRVENIIVYRLVTMVWLVTKAILSPGSELDITADTVLAAWPGFNREHYNALSLPSVLLQKYHIRTNFIQKGF